MMKIHHDEFDSPHGRWFFGEFFFFLRPENHTFCGFAIILIFLFVEETNSYIGGKR